MFLGFGIVYGLASKGFRSQRVLELWIKKFSWDTKANAPLNSVGIPSNGGGCPKLEKSFNAMFVNV